ncbi:MAG: TonB-dependent receptor, partial [Planctomycetes bacterium]|nr:TonB-dependent receptor [Planctomycetota bacterium]
MLIKKEFKYDILKKCGGTTMNKSIFRNCLLVIILFLIGTYGFPQIRETGIIQGNVTDTQGVPLPGATVIVASPNLIGGHRSVVADKDGFYQFRSLPIGAYKVTVSMPSFDTLVKSGLAIHANLTSTVDFKMPQTAMKQEVEVTAELSKIDIKSNATGTIVMTDELIMTIPVSKRWGGLMDLATGMDLSSGGTGSLSQYQASAYGMGVQGESNAYMFDGINMKSPNWGWLRMSPDFNIIKEAAIQGLGLPAEFGQYTGAVLTAVTKSGSNKLSTFNEFRYNGRRWNSQNLGDYSTERFYVPADKEREFEAGSYFDIGMQLGGKIIYDKFWFFLSGEYDDSKLYPLGTTVSQKIMNQKAFLKLTYQINPSNKLNASASYDNQKMGNIAAGPSFSPEADGNKIEPGWLFSLSWTSFLSPTALLDFKLAYNEKQYRTIPKAGYDVPSRVDLLTGITYDNLIKWQDFPDETFHSNAQLAYYVPKFLVGSHDLKIGTELEYSSPSINIGFSGNAMYQYLGDQPFQMRYNEVRISNHNFRTFVAFAQDTWTVSKRLTFNLGLRYDNYWYKSSPDRG